MKRILLLSTWLFFAIAVQAQLDEDFTPNPTGWILDQGAQFNSVNGNDAIVTPAGGGNNHARIGTPAVSKTSNTFKVCYDIFLYTSNLNAQMPFPCNTFMDVLFVNAAVTTSNQAEMPANILARVDNFLLATNGGSNCFTFNFPPAVVATNFKVFLVFHAACQQTGLKLVVDNVKISGVDEVCAGATCPPSALDDVFNRASPSELSFDAVLYGGNINYPAPGTKAVDNGGTDNDPNDTYAHLKWTLVTPPLPADGTVVVNADGTCTITRNSTAVSQLTFVYQLCDDGADDNFATTGDNLCDNATVTCTWPSIGLPILLADFSAIRRDAIVTLKWTTHTESNNSRFEIQRCVAGAAYQTIASIASKAVGGNSDVSLQYEYSESNLSKLVLSYRLVQIDKDGTRTIYGARMVHGMDGVSKMILTPNPAAAGRCTIIFNDVQSRDIVISNLNGKIVQRWTGYAQTNLQVSGLAPGMYLVQVIATATADKQTQKLIVTQ
jgi:hypothetical protein